MMSEEGDRRETVARISGPESPGSKGVSAGLKAPEGPPTHTDIEAPAAAREELPSEEQPAAAAAPATPPRPAPRSSVPSPLPLDEPLLEPGQARSGPSSEVAFWRQRTRGVWHKSPRDVLSSKVLWLLVLSLAFTNTLVLVFSLVPPVRVWASGSVLLRCLSLLAGLLVPLLLTVWQDARLEPPWNACSLAVLVTAESLLLASLAALVHSVTLPLAVVPALATLLLLAVSSLLPGETGLIGGFTAFLVVPVTLVASLILVLVVPGLPWPAVWFGALGALVLTDYIAFSLDWVLALPHLETRRQEGRLQATSIALDTLLAPAVLLFEAIDNAQQRIANAA